MGDPGGGSDHVGFLHHLAVPCATLGAHGSAGDSYHSNYDTLAWYRRVVGEDYASALAVTRACVGISAALAGDRILPMRTESIGRAVTGWVEALRRRATPEGSGPLEPALARDLDAIALRAEAITELGARIDPRLDEVARSSTADAARRARIDGLLMALDRAWYDPRGLRERPWYRNLSAASDRETAYGALPLPLLAEALSVKDPGVRRDAMERTAEALDRLNEVLQELDASIDPID